MSGPSVLGGAAERRAYARPAIDLRRMLRLSPRAAHFDVRGFSTADAARRARLEAVGGWFVAGYNIGLLTDEGVLEAVARAPLPFQGFMAEGAAMGAAVSDAMPLGRRRLASLLADLAPRYLYLSHVGAGLAMARVPWHRRRILALLDPLLWPLAFDGLGFHDGYFRPRKALAGWRRSVPGYAAKAYDQGVGRAIWFISCGSPSLASRTIRAQSADRHADLFAGLGLAMAYAGPVTRSDIATVTARAGKARPAFRQGIAFACEAHALSGFFPDHCEAAAEAIDTDPPSLAALVRGERARLRRGESDLPDYEVWRSAVSDALSDGSRERT